MWDGTDSEFRRGLGLSLLGISLLVAAVFFGLLGVMSGPSTGVGVSFMGIFLVIAGIILSLIGAGLLGSLPAYRRRMWPASRGGSRTSAREVPCGSRPPGPP